jgi:methyl-accepting chemotaxis protein
MNEINLLPWREQRYKCRKKEFIICWIGIFAFSVVLVLLLKMLIVHQIKKYHLYNDQLLHHLNHLLPRVEKTNQLKEEINALRKSVNSMQNNHKMIRKILDFIRHLNYLATPDLFIRIIEYHPPYLSLAIRAVSKKQSLSVIKALQLKFNNYKLQWIFTNESKLSACDFLIFTKLK